MLSSSWYFLTPRSELSSNITAPALFRYISRSRQFREGQRTLNSGNTKATAQVWATKLRRFSTWAPKALATIRALAGADTLQHLAIVVQFQRKPPTAPVSCASALTAQREARRPAQPGWPPGYR